MESQGAGDGAGANDVPTRQESPVAMGGKQTDDDAYRCGSHGSSCCLAKVVATHVLKVVSYRHGCDDDQLGSSHVRAIERAHGWFFHFAFRLGLTRSQRGARQRIQVRRYTRSSPCIASSPTAPVVQVPCDANTVMTMQMLSTALAPAFSQESSDQLNATANLTQPHSFPPHDKVPPASSITKPTFVIFRHFTRACRWATC